MRIVTFDAGTATDVEWAEVHGLFAAQLAAVAPAEPVPTVRELRREYDVAPSVRPSNWAVRDASGEMVGFARLAVRDGKDTGYLHALLVTPDHRRAGLGRRLLALAAERARAGGCRNLVGWTADPAGREFLAAVGARVAGGFRKSVARLPVTAPPRRVPAGYRLLTWTGPAPADRLDSYARAREAINDAPHDPDEAPDRYTPERIREMEATLARRGQHLRVTVALDGAGTVVGFTGLYVSPEPGSAVATGDAAVLPEHRGRGLIAAVKYESLRLLAADRPDVTEVTTGNDVGNAPMLAVNARLGFVETVTWTQALLDLPGSP
ncbi:GNAT family N-acetyltransferase [Longispora sp. K20-0274]|uniref:GNAT family N-acetyltransferase n=1 Tax=Longispora sp. K20-0274 TaxID=3088255 RepID=UPI00399A718B